MVLQILLLQQPKSLQWNINLRILGSVLKNKSAIEDRQGMAKAGFAVL